jgi:2-iminobutanoate/2-iminopropanoate deaminase
VSNISFVNPPDAGPPVGQYSNLSIVEPPARLVHVAGQLPLGPDGELVADDLEAQMEHVFSALAALLIAAGSSMTRIVYLRTYLTRPEDYAAFKALRARLFERHGVSEPPPATTIVVAWLVGGSLIEVDAVAVADEESADHRRSGRSRFASPT